MGRLVKRIGLVHCSNKQFAENQNYGLKFPPVWAFVLSGYIKARGHTPELFDLNVSDRDVITECDVYFFSGINQDLMGLVELSAFVRERFPAARQFIGGPIAWSFDQAGELNKLSSFDHVCVGDGEILVPRILEALEGDVQLPGVIREAKRFDMAASMPMDHTLIEDTHRLYYGAVIEVSRGCPFLCEFCDIRVMPDNNRNHNRSIDSILRDLDVYRRLGVRNIQIACDNFIGDLDWANEVVDAIIRYNAKHDFSPSFYTWLTINISRHPDLMRRMRIAGFDNLFIGVESFEANTLIETAKLQNTKVDIVDAIRSIQSFGFIVVAGLIFGFDSDTENSFRNTLDGIRDAGLLSGDASLLTALPGTPLFRRMRLSGRLRHFQHDAMLGGHKYVTNIRYLLPKDTLVDGYISFSKTFLEGPYQHQRLVNFYSIIKDSPNFVSVSRSGYTSVGAFLRKALLSPSLLMFHAVRMLPLAKPSRLVALVRAVALALRMRVRHGIGLQYFVFWLFIWVNALNKYRHISPDDFHVESVPSEFEIRKILPKGYLEEATENIPQNKINAQFRATSRQLEAIIEARESQGGQA